MGTDASPRCAKCGGEFSRKRILVEGLPFHEGCVIMSYPSHTPDDMSRMGTEIERLTAEWDRLRAALQEIADEKPWPGIGQELQEMARHALEQTPQEKT